MFIPIEIDKEYVQMKQKNDITLIQHIALFRVDNEYSHWGLDILDLFSLIKQYKIRVECRYISYHKKRPNKLF